MTSTKRRRTIPYTETRTPPMPEEPCSELPGTAEKVERMRMRASAGRQVFHQGDAVWDGEVADKVGAMLTLLVANKKPRS